MTKNLPQRSNFTLIILGLITTVAFLIRSWQLNDLPAQLNRDEAAIGYNAYLLSETGKDEWERSWPLALESFGDYKLPGYVWLTVAVGKLFGWHDWVVRLPSVVAGSLLPLAVYAWMRASQRSQTLGLWAAGLIAVAPFSFFYSRMAFEANVALTLLILWLAGVAVKKTFLQKKLPSHLKSVFLDLGLIFLAILACLTYNTPLLLLPFFLLGLPFYWGWSHWRQWLVCWIGLLIVTGGGFYALTQLFGQKSAITVFSDPTVWTHFVEQPPLHGLAKLILGRWWGFLAQLIAAHWLQTWSPVFLVLKGGAHPWHTLPGAGHMFWTTYISSGLGLGAAALGSLALLKRKSWPNATIGWWLYLTLISLAPAVVTVDAPHATRSLLFLVLLVIWAAEGFLWVAHRFQKRAILWWVLVSCMLVAEVTWYGYRYFGTYPQNQGTFQPGIAQIIPQLQHVAPTGPIAIVGDGYAYALWAWYSHMPASEFFATVVKQAPDRIGFRYGEKIGRFHFIAHAEDRSTSEPVLVEWQNDHWEIQRF